MDFNIPPLPDIVAQVVVLFLAIGLHEYAHCKFADMAGDPTPRFYGRVTLDLTKHFELTGTLMMIFTTITGFGIGWGRAAPMDPRKMRNPRWDLFMAVIAGPLSNLLQACIYALLLRVTMRYGIFEAFPDNLYGHFFQALLIYGVLTNIALCVFNLIPFGPLDGHWLLGLLLPERERVAWFRFNRQIGRQGLFIAIIILQSAHVSLLSGPVTKIFQILTGTTDLI